MTYFNDKKNLKDFIRVTGCVTGPTRSSRHFRRWMRQFLQNPCAFRTELTHQTHAVKIVPCP